MRPRCLYATPRWVCAELPGSAAVPDRALLDSAGRSADSVEEDLAASSSGEGSSERDSEGGNSAVVDSVAVDSAVVGSVVVVGFGADTPGGPAVEWVART